jgi:hypothetical protein
MTQGRVLSRGRAPPFNLPALPWTERFGMGAKKQPDKSPSDPIKKTLY